MDCCLRKSDCFSCVAIVDCSCHLCNRTESISCVVCIDVIVQRLGDTTAAGIYKLLFSTLNGKASIVSLYALPVCFVWTVTAYHLGHRQTQLAKLRGSQQPEASSR